MFARLWNGPETHPEAKTMAQYYTDLAQAVADVRAEFPNANQDTGFKQAADVIAQLVKNGMDMEIVGVTELPGKNSKRKELLGKIGDDRLPNVTGEASKLLAEKYCALLQAILNKEYWPSEDCPSLLGQSYLAAYADGFESKIPSMNSAIENLNAKIEAFQPEEQARPGM